MLPWWDDPRLVDTLPVSREAYLGILARLDAARPGRRRCEALPARILLRFADGARAVYAVKVHELARRGLACLHGFPVDPGTDCEVALRKLDQQVIVRAGSVARCRDLGEKIHEVHVELTSPIEPGELLPTRSAGEAVVLAVHRPPAAAG
jgi:hypothetical protein